MGWVHCDIKPNNILVGKKERLGDKSILRGETSLYLIDFGMCDRYLDANEEQIFARETTEKKGNMNFISTNQIRKLSNIIK